MANEAVEYIKETLDSIFNYKKNKKKKNDAIEQINDFINGYAEDKLPSRPKLPDVPQYERMEYEAPADEEVEKRAQDELAEYKALGERGIDNEIGELKKKYAADSENERRAHAQARESLQKSYESAKQNTDYDMLKRGLSRSSIAANKKAALERDEAAAVESLNYAFGEKLGEINRNLNELSAKREKALDEFNLSYAAKLTERINELKEERREQTEKALKYNNSLAEKEYEAKADKIAKESDLYGKELSNAQKENEFKGNVSSADYLNVYNAIAAKLREINKNDAREIILNNPNVRESVGNTYYYKLYDEFCR